MQRVNAFVGSLVPTATLQRFVTEVAAIPAAVNGMATTLTTYTNGLHALATSVDAAQAFLTLAQVPLYD